MKEEEGVKGRESRGEGRERKEREGEENGSRGRGKVGEKGVRKEMIEKLNPFPWQH